MDRKRQWLTGRELAGFGLLVLLLAGGLLLSWHLCRQDRAVAKNLEDCAWQALSGQWEAARSGAEAARQSWQQHRALHSVLADHTPMEQVEDLFAELSVWAAAGERTEFARICRVLSGRLQAMAALQQPSWQNIF